MTDGLPGSAQTRAGDDTLSGGAALLRMLEAHGVKHVFGLPGDTSLPWYDALATLDHGITHVLTRDERSAGYMADAYARISGRPGVCEGPSGGGATYLLPALVEADQSAIALLGITTDVSVASYGKYPLTEVDQRALMAPLTSWNTVIARSDQIPRMVRAAFRAMTTGRPGAAHLGLPYDIQYDPVPAAEIWADPAHAHFPAQRSGPDPDAVAAALDAIASAQRPVVVCGGGVVSAGACAELQRFCTALDLPVLTSISGQGALAETDPHCGGVVGSNGGTPETWALLEAADLVVFLGCRGGSTTTARWQAPKPGTRVVHADADPQAIGANYPTEVALVGDLRLTLSALNQLLDEEDGLAGKGGIARVGAASSARYARFEALAAEDHSPIRPERIVAALMAVLPEDATLVSDPGTSCPYLNAWYRLPRPGRHYLTNRAHGALGYALSAAIGAWFAAPERRVLACMGDGSFGFCCGELETLARLDAPIVIVVFNNASFGWIKASQRDDCAQRYYKVDFSRGDHAAIAAAFGLASWRVEAPGELLPALRAALDSGRPALVDVICQPLEESQAPVSRWMG